jgi:hypothetical protein
MTHRLKCPLDGTSCVISTSAARLGGAEQVQETCATCGAGCGYTLSAAPPAAEGNDDPTELDKE